MTKPTPQAHSTRLPQRKIMIIGAVLLTAAVIILLALTTRTPADHTRDNTRSFAGSDEQPRTLEAARSALQRQWDRRTASDYAGVYDLFARDTTSRISRADYATLMKACDKSLGVAGGFAIIAEDPRWANEAHTRVTVTLRHPMTTATRDVIYQGGQWAAVATPESLQMFTDRKSMTEAEVVRKRCDPLNQ